MQIRSDVFVPQVTAGGRGTGVERDGRVLRSLPERTLLRAPPRQPASQWRPPGAPPRHSPRGSRRAASPGRRGADPQRTGRARLPADTSMRSLSGEPNRQKAHATVWGAFRVRPPLGHESVGEGPVADVIESAVRIPAPGGGQGRGSADVAAEHLADAVFSVSCPQLDVNAELCLQLVPAAFSGAGAVVIGYGPDGGGKSEVLFGVPGSLADPVCPGEPPEDGQSVGGSHSGGAVAAFIADVLRRVADLAIFDMSLLVSVLRVRGGELEDLIDPSATPQIREAVAECPEVCGATWREVWCPADWTTVWTRARARLGRGQRGHGSGVVCIVELRRRDRRNGAEVTTQVMFGELPAVPQTGQAEDRDAAREAGFANAATGKVLEALASGGVHVPWREHRFTRVMQTALTQDSGDAARVVAVCCLQPTADRLVEAQSAAALLSRVLRSRRGGVRPTADARGLAQKLQARLDKVAATAHPQWQRMEQELGRLRREVAVLRGGGGESASREQPMERSRPDAGLQRAVDALRRHCATGVSDATGSIAQLASQLCSREQALRSTIHRQRSLARAARAAADPRHHSLLDALMASADVCADSVPTMSGERWLGLLQELGGAVAAPSLADPRSAPQPLRMARDAAAFLRWWEGDPEYEPSDSGADSPPPQRHSAARCPPPDLRTADPAAQVLTREMPSPRTPVLPDPVPIAPQRTPSIAPSPLRSSPVSQPVQHAGSPASRADAHPRSEDGPTQGPRRGPRSPPEVLSPASLPPALPFSSFPQPSPLSMAADRTPDSAPSSWGHTPTRPLDSRVVDEPAFDRELEWLRRRAGLPPRSAEGQCTRPRPSAVQLQAGGHSPPAGADDAATDWSLSPHTESGTPGVGRSARSRPSVPSPAALPGAQPAEEHVRAQSGGNGASERRGYSSDSPPSPSGHLDHSWATAYADLSRAAPVAGVPAHFD
eukprot:TRINITY_DN19077_c0_g1_i1.p1 TRINITY_DN19077_c0_g1~~TRINITY_DN19077_c0_g1_i1.p1  ORF type:complete len:968 (+),score=258.79 TRINITY_DN19077_c0_g1_i1:52-2904(+)